MITIAVLGTFDTKGAEHAYVADRIRQLGARALLIDIGTSEAPQVVPDITREQVVSAASKSGLVTATIDHAMPPSKDRGEAIARMTQAVPHLLRELVDQHAIQGVISLGGTGGTALGTAAMRATAQSSDGLRIHGPKPKPQGERHSPRTRKANRIDSTRYSESGCLASRNSFESTCFAKRCLSTLQVERHSFLATKYLSKFFHIEVFVRRT